MLPPHSSAIPASGFISSSFAWKNSSTRAPYSKSYRPRNSDEKKHTCMYANCGKTFYHGYNLNRHYKLKHGGVAPSTINSIVGEVEANRENGGGTLIGGTSGGFEYDGGFFNNSEPTHAASREDFRFACNSIQGGERQGSETMGGESVEREEKEEEEGS